MSAPLAESYTHGALAVEGPNERTVSLVRSTGARVYAEIGVYLGATAEAVAEVLGGEGELHLLDFADRVEPVASRLRARGFENVVAHANSRRALDSYNWSLMKLLRDGRAGSFDYVFLDGAHTWAHDALAFLLVDRLLAPGGHVDFDDYGWTLARSPSMSPEAFAPTRRLYSDEQIETPQVALVVDLLVRPDPRYEEVVPDKLFRKRPRPPAPPAAGAPAAASQIASATRVRATPPAAATAPPARAGRLPA
jgi:predicted O-methyltransferase YrrM